MIGIAITAAAFDRIVVRFPVLGYKAALAHAVGDETEQAYRRGDALEKRREVMEAWAAFLTDSADATKIVALSGRRRRS